MLQLLTAGSTSISVEKHSILSLDKVTPSGLHCGHTDKRVPFWSVFSLLSPHSALGILSHQHKSPQWHRMRPNAHQKHGSVCIVSQSARGPTHGDPPLADLCVFFHFISLHSSWLCDLHYVFFSTDYQASVCFQASAHQLSTVASPFRPKPHRHRLSLNINCSIIQKATGVYVSLVQT